MIETAIVAAVFGMCALFMILLLVALLRESFEAERRMEGLRLTYLTKIYKAIWDTVGSLSNRRVE